jgi:hypothetical protein
MGPQKRASGFLRRMQGCYFVCRLARDCGVVVSEAPLGTMCA